MSTDARNAIYERLRQTGGDATGNDIARALHALGRAPRPALAAPNVCEAFAMKVRANRGTLAFAPDRSRAVRAVADYLYRHQRSHRLVAGNDPRLAAMPWRDGGVLPRFGAAEAGEPVALSFARLGVAETGAVLTWTGRANPAANNLLPEHHLVLLNRDDLVATLDDAWRWIGEHLAREGRPRGMQLVAGPSSTADIEGQLVYGAHGPRHWHVIVIGAVSDAALAHAGDTGG